MRGEGKVVVVVVWFWSGSCGVNEPVAKAYHAPEAGSWIMQGSGKSKGSRGVFGWARGWTAVIVVVVAVDDDADRG
jgi:hypothetical protein